MLGTLSLWYVLWFPWWLNGYFIYCRNMTAVLSLPGGKSYPVHLIFPVIWLKKSQTTSQQTLAEIENTCKISFSSGSNIFRQIYHHQERSVWLYFDFMFIRFIISDKETFFSNAQRSLMVYTGIMLRAKYDDEDQQKFGNFVEFFFHVFYILGADIATCSKICSLLLIARQQVMISWNLNFSVLNIFRVQL